MVQLIDKAALVAEINRLDEFYHLSKGAGGQAFIESLLSSLDTLELKTDNSLENFKSLQHITKDLHQTLEDWGYAPNLYFFDKMWHVSWISCEEGDGIKDFEGNTPEEAIDKACDWFHSTFCNG